jgi:murein tripeptide amidase MpaA
VSGFKRNSKEFEKMDLKTLFFVVLTIAVVSAKKSYHGYKVLRTQALDKHTSEVLGRLTERDFDFWADPAPGRSADIMASPHDLADLEKFLSQHQIQYSIMIEDVESVVQLSNSRPSVRPSRKGFGSPRYTLTWDDYYSHETINEFIDELAATHDFVETVSIGTTVEGRDLRVVQIKKAGAGKPNVFIDAGIHAREWIANAVATFMIRELVENYADNKNIVDNLNIHILPMANPDGYEFSRSDDRFWRKNRVVNAGSSCKGVDLNRNFGFHWAESGVSFSPCSDVYCGEAAFTERETAAIKKYTESLRPTPILGHSIHSYSQLWLWPYGFDYTSRPDNWQEIKKLAEDASDALQQVHGTYFDPINSADLYPAAGASDDWYRGGLGTRYAYTTELRDTGLYGFALPPSQIVASGEELFAGMKVIFEKCIADSKV